MKKILLVFLSVLFSATILAQRPANDSLQQWREKRAVLARHIDSLRIEATGLIQELQYLAEEANHTQAAMNMETNKGIRMDNAKKAVMDSLSQHNALLSTIKNGIQDQFDNFLVQLDSCIGVCNDLDAKISHKVSFFLAPTSISSIALNAFPTPFTCFTISTPYRRSSFYGDERSCPGMSFSFRRRCPS